MKKRYLDDYDEDFEDEDLDDDDYEEDYDDEDDDWEEEDDEPIPGQFNLQRREKLADKLLTTSTKDNIILQNIGFYSLEFIDE